MTKLVRDNIPGSSFASGETLRLALVDKLHEELDEVESAVTQGDVEAVCEELADLIEVAYALATWHGIGRDTLEEARKDKARAKGVFDLGVMR